MTGAVCVATAAAGAAVAAVVAAGSLLSSTPLFSGVGARRKPPLFTGAPTLSSGFSVLLLIGRTSAGAGWFIPVASPPSRFGRAGRAYVCLATVVQAIPGPESEPSGATMMGSIRTLVLFEVFRRSADARESEITRSLPYGPRSLIRTTIMRPLARLVIRA